MNEISHMNVDEHPLTKFFFWTPLPFEEAPNPL